MVYEASQVVQKHFMMVQKFPEGAGLLHMMEKNHFGVFSMQKKETTAAKKKTTKKCETTINSQFLNANHTRNLNTLETVNS